jgi:23S rRNA pseudouridine955/2504/2580 synthase
MVTLTVPADAQGLRLDRFLRKHLPQASLSFIYKCLRNGVYRINDKKSTPDYRLRTGDVITLFLDEKDYEKLVSKPSYDAPVKKTFDVLFEDEDIMAVNKPPFLASQPGTGVERQNLINQIKTYLKDHKGTPALANRLDRGTSGIVLVGKHRQATLALFHLFKNQEVEKNYVALVKGHFKKKQGILQNHLKKVTEQFQHKMLVLPAPEEGTLFAETVYKVLDESPAYSLLHLELKTGKMHQIRVQLAHEGHPLVGDKVYGDADINKQYLRVLRRQFLHAYKVTFVHPFTKKLMSVVAPLPEDLQRVLERHFTEKAWPWTSS